MRSTRTGAIVMFVIWCLTSHAGHRNPEPVTIDPETERSGALEALDFWTRARSYPDPDISPGKFYAAYLRSKQQADEFSGSPGAVSVWEPIGPTNLTGRTISIAINPRSANTVYVGAASGGLWRSRTGGLGSDWTRIATGYPVLGVGAIAIDAQDTNTIYIGTGEVYRDQGALGGLVLRTTRGSYGIGILKTTDGGSTWSKSLDWSFDQERGVQAIRINPLNGRTVLAATTVGLYRTTDAGQTWNATLSLPMAEDIVIDAADTARILASIGNFDSPGRGLYYSSDGGVTWLSVGSFPAYSGKALLETYPPNPNAVYASVADSTTGVSSLWKSGDFGSTWSLISSQDVAGVQGWYSHFVAVKPDDSTRVVRAGVSIYYSVNGGTSLSGSGGSYSDHHQYAHHPADPSILYVVNDDGVYRSTNFGTSFSNVGFGMQTGQFYNGFSNSQSDSLLAIGQVQDHIPGYKYTGSLSWSRSVLDECGWTVINPLNDWTMFAVNRNGGSAGRSTNRGTSFQTVVSFGPSGSWNSPIIIAPSDTNVVYVGLDRVYKSVNRGSNWFSTSTVGFLDGNLSLSMAVSYTNPDTLYVGKAPLGAPAHLFMTPDGGATWSDITGSLPDRYPMDLAVDPNDSRIVYAALGGANSGHLFRSSDAGQHWSDVTGTLPDIPTTAVLVDPANSNLVYAGNDIGVYVSTNAGGSWNSFSDGLPDAVLVADLSLTSSNRMLRATTHGNGVYQRRMPTASASMALTSPNGGEEWDATTTHAISWSALLVTAVRLEYSTNDGTTWLTIADSVPAPPGSYSWHVPYTPTVQGRVRITSLDGSNLRDTSDAALSITFHGSVLGVTAGWNMISVPVKVADPHTSTLFPNASSPAFDYEGSYQPQPTLLNGLGYWLRYASDGVAPLLGDSIAADTIAVSSGWNLIGSISFPLRTSAITSDPPGAVLSRAFGYSSGYQASDTLFPGRGYWLKTSSEAQLFLTNSLAKRPPAAASRNELESLNRLTITDAAGSAQTLYFGIDDVMVDALRYEMPPVPPGGAFDARFASQRMVELFGHDGHSRIGILLSGAVYPLTIRSHMLGGTGSLVINGKEASLREGVEFTLTAPPWDLTLEIQTGPAATAAPKRFALLQNYPNPFNPATEVRYEIPVESRVVLRVYDALGRLAATLVDERKSPGTYAARWDAGAMPSGVYFYNLSAGAFNQTKAMSLIR